MKLQLFEFASILACIAGFSIASILACKVTYNVNGVIVDYVATLQVRIDHYLAPTLHSWLLQIRIDHFGQVY